MSQRNVYLVDIGTGTDRNLLPLSIGLIASYARSLPNLNAAFRFHLLFLRSDPAAMAAGMINPAVVGFACYVWNFRATMAVARTVKLAHPQALIVAGGYSVPKDEVRIKEFFAAHPYVDVLVHGEGEYTFADLMSHILVNGDLSQVNGITFQNPGSEFGFITTPRRERIDNLDTLPSPFLNGVFDEVMARYGSSVTGAVWETNRGCPFSCTFCDWGNADVNKVKKFDIERLNAEIDWMSRNKIFYIYGADANFGIFYERDSEIASRISDLCRATGFPRYLMINWTKNSHERIAAIADRLAAGGVVTTITLSMQSFNDPTLEAIKRRNIKHDSFLKLKQAFHDRDLPTYTELILGLPLENYASFRKGLDLSMTSRLDDHFVVYLCTLLDNTEMSSQKYRARYGIESRKCAIGMSRRQFDDSHDMEIEDLVVGTASMPISEWRKAYLYAYFSTVMFNHRVMFFAMQFLQKEFGIAHSDFLTYCVDSIHSDPAAYPLLAKAVAHIERQCQLILDSVCSMSGPGGLEDLSFTPHEAALAILLSDSNALYVDLSRLLRNFCVQQQYSVSDVILDDIILYQRIRMPSWADKPDGEHGFRTNIPYYFDAIENGVTPPSLQVMFVSVAIESALNADSYRDFAARVVRGGHTVVLNSVAIH